MPYFPQKQEENVMSNTEFKPLTHGSKDIVLAAHYNVYGKRLVTGGADHRIRVFEKNQDNKWETFEVWKAHNAQVLDVKWSGRASGEIIGSVSEDLKLKIWQENPSRKPRSGRRWQCVYSQSCGHLSIYTSLDFVTVRQDTFLALTTRDGMLSLHEPVVPTKYSDWREVDQFWIDDHQYGRGIATSFKVAFNQAQRPNWKAVAAGVDKNALTVAVAAMNVVKIYRVQNSKADRSGPYQFQAPVAELTGARGNVRDMTWASGSSRDYDILVTASADGYVRVYQIYANPADELLPIDQASISRPIQRANTHAPQVWTSTAPSGIGAGLAGNTRNQTSGQSKDSQVPHEWKIVAELKQEGVCKVEWNYGGMVLSTGDDGRGLLWSKGLDGKWQEFANIEPEDHDQ